MTQTRLLEVGVNVKYCVIVTKDIPVGGRNIGQQLLQSFIFKIPFVREEIFHSAVGYIDFALEFDEPADPNIRPPLNASRARTFCTPILNVSGIYMGFRPLNLSNPSIKIAGSK